MSHHNNPYWEREFEFSGAAYQGRPGCHRVSRNAVVPPRSRSTRQPKPPVHTRPIQHPRNHISPAVKCCLFSFNFLFWVSFVLINPLDMRNCYNAHNIIYVSVITMNIQGLFLQDFLEILKQTFQNYEKT